jgi:hypothetical protein
MMRAESLQVIAASGFLASASAVLAQTETEPALETPPSQTSDHVRFSVGGGGIYQFDSDIDSGGDFNVLRLNGAVGVDAKLEENLDLTLRFTYALDSYDFSEAISLGAGADEPWEDIHTASAGAVLSWQVDPHWTIFGGPVIQTSRESGTDFDDGLTAGGLFGATYAASRELVVGGGLIITSQIEESPRFSPVIIVNWVLKDDWRVASRTTGNILTRTGAELVYDPQGQWEFAFGIASYFSRFRLDHDGPSPKGIGEENSTPIWLRATYGESNFHVDAVGGLSLGGKLRLEDEGGHRISDEDYDAAPFAGVFATVEF